jgi:hypothetical protein
MLKYQENAVVENWEKDFENTEMCFYASAYFSQYQRRDEEPSGAYVRNAYSRLINEFVKLNDGTEVLVFPLFGTPFTFIKGDKCPSCGHVFEPVGTAAPAAYLVPSHGNGYERRKKCSRCA